MPRDMSMGRFTPTASRAYWSLLKRSIKGTYISIEPFHLFRYLDEQAFRFNTRHELDSERANRLVGSVTGRRLTYKRTGRRFGVRVTSPFRERQKA